MSDRSRVLAHHGAVVTSRGRRSWRRDGLITCTPAEVLISAMYPPPTEHSGPRISETRELSAIAQGVTCREREPYQISLLLLGLAGGEGAMTASAPVQIDLSSLRRACARKQRMSLAKHHANLFRKRVRNEAHSKPTSPAQVDRRPEGPSKRAPSYITWGAGE